MKPKTKRLLITLSISILILLLVSLVIDIIIVTLTTSNKNINSLTVVIPLIVSMVCGVLALVTSSLLVVGFIKDKKSSSNKTKSK